MSRATDETGHVQPTYAENRKVRGTRSIYHNNSIQTWLLQDRGANTTVAVAIVANGASKNVAKTSVPIPVPEAAALKSADVNATLNKYACTACHGIDNKIVGPSFKEIAAKQGKQADAVAYLMGKIKNGSSGIYGSVSMPPQSVGEADLKKVAQWIASGAVK